jgi:zinc D-Ala-D-Ala carboxypeptidase
MRTKRWFLFALLAGGILVLAGYLILRSDRTDLETAAPKRTPSSRPDYQKRPRQSVSLCGRYKAETSDDGRLYGHFRYQSVTPSALVKAPRFARGNCQGVHRDMRDDFERLLASARKAVGTDLYTISCYRSEPYQAELFCGSRSRGIPPERRVKWVAPPGYSEHHTGYVVDFGSASQSGCNFRFCFADTPAGKWLIANAAAFGFEPSYPFGGMQGVSPEPWHWRWVGHNESKGSATARQIFDEARRRFPTSAQGAINASSPR